MHWEEAGIPTHRLSSDLMRNHGLINLLIYTLPLPNENSKQLTSFFPPLFILTTFLQGSLGLERAAGPKSFNKLSWQSGDLNLIFLILVQDANHYTTLSLWLN